MYILLSVLYCIIYIHIYYYIICTYDYTDLMQFFSKLQKFSRSAGKFHQTSDRRADTKWRSIYFSLTKIIEKTSTRNN